MRQFVFVIFSLLFFAAVAAVIVVIATVVVRGGLTALHHVFDQTIPAVFHALWTDPWYIVALIIAVLLLWCCPWEEGGSDAAPSPLRRGRQINNLQTARRLAAPPSRRTPRFSRASSSRPIASRSSRIRRR